MSEHIRKLDWRFDVEPARRELASMPHLWNQIGLRTEFPDSPHRESDDIWLRCAADMREFTQPHSSVWYEAAVYLPTLVDLCGQMAHLTKAKALGGILITRVPAKKQIYPHVDEGWHARYYEKFAIQIDSHPDQCFCFEGQELHTLPGESFWFDNAFSHWVLNPSEKERITLIICLRRD